MRVRINRKVVPRRRLQTPSYSTPATTAKCFHTCTSYSTCQPQISLNTNFTAWSQLDSGHTRSKSSSLLQRRTITTSTSPKDPPAVLINDLPRGFQEVVVDFSDGSDAIRFPSFWLRDHCRCKECCHPQTKQRQLDTFALDPDTKALDAEFIPSTPSTSPDASSDADAGLKIAWSGSPSHTSIYPIPWLKQQTPFSSLPPSSRQNPRGKWKHVSPSAPSYPSVDYASAMNTDKGLSQLVSHIRTYGFAFIPDTPSDSPDHTKELAERIGTTIRHTHYGGFWEVVSEANPIDTAYTNLFLPNHTDNTYFTDPCGLQMFHCLSHTSSASTTTSLGGESTLVDGFAAAAYLHKHHPQAYRLLSTIPITSHASGDPHAGPFLNNALHTAGHPVFTHNGSAASGAAYHHPRNLSQIRWNNADRHESTVFPTHATMMGWYEAARIWDGIVNPKTSPNSSGGEQQKSEFEIVVKLQPGTPVVFDNWRVLHGRKAFAGVRRLCGAYVGMDDFLAKGRVVDERVRRAEVGDDA